MPIQNLANKAQQIGKTMSQYAPSPMSLLRNISPLAASNVAGLSQITNYIPGLKEQIGSIVFDALTGKKQNGLPGINAVDGTLVTDNFTLPEEYIVTINSKKGGLVPAILQDKLQFRVTSDWQPIVQPSSLKGVNLFLQLLPGKMSAVTSISSRRIWMGTSPINIVLSLRFEAVTDAKKEVVIPCLNLQKIASPARGDDFQLGGIGGTIPLLAPPGPHPFQLPSEIELSKAEVTGEGKEQAAKLLAVMKEGQDEISIQIGSLWQFKSVIIKEVEVTFDNKYTSEGHPISASAEVIFETYEILTKEDIDEVYLGVGE